MEMICIKCKNELEISKENGLSILPCKFCNTDKYGYIVADKGFSKNYNDGRCICEGKELELKENIKMKHRHVFVHECKRCGNEISFIEKI